MPIAYDRAVIERHAANLYARADSLAATYALIGLLLGLIPWYLLHKTAAGPLLAGFALVCGYGGRRLGESAGFRYRLEAQQALCLAQVEANTANMARME